MIQALSGFPTMVMAFVCNGQVTRQDYETVLMPAIEHALTYHEKVRLYYQIDPGFSGMELGAMWDDFKVGMEHLFRWDRIAVVTDVEWIRYTFNAFSFVIPCTAKVFHLEETPAAKEWILEGVAQQDLDSFKNRVDRFLIAIDKSEASIKTVTYVGRVLRGHTDAQVRLLHVLPPIPPELLEFGGAEQPQLEQRLSDELRQNQARWIETAKNDVQGSIDKALAILLESGLSSDQVSTTFSSPIHRPDVVREIFEAAQTWKCGTLVVGRHTRSWIRELGSSHVGEELVRKGQGFAIWIVE